MLRKILPVLLFLRFCSRGSGQDSRHFTFHYAFTVKNLPRNKRFASGFPLRIPIAFQEVRIVSAKGDLPLKKFDETKDGNETLLRANLKSPLSPNCTSTWNTTSFAGSGSRFLREPRTFRPFRFRPEKAGRFATRRTCPTTGVPAELAAKVTQGKTAPLDKARAIYDYVFTTMRYDKTGTGWGHGDVLYACTQKRATAPTFTRCLLPWRARKKFPHASKSVFLTRRST